MLYDQIKKSRNWILIEALICTLPSIVLLVAAIPMIIFGMIEIIIPTTGDSRPVFDRLGAILPYFAGIFGLFALWRFAFIIANGGNIRFGFIFWLGLISGIVACAELLTLVPLEVQIIACMPLWGFIIHLLILNNWRNR